MSRALRCLRESYDTLRIMAGSSQCTSDGGRRYHFTFRFQEMDGEIADPHIQDTDHFCQKSCASEDIVRNDACRIRLQHHNAKDLANILALELHRRFRNAWKTVDENVARSRSDFEGGAHDVSEHGRSGKKCMSRAACFCCTSLP